MYMCVRNFEGICDAVFTYILEFLLLNSYSYYGYTHFLKFDVLIVFTHFL